MTSSQQPMLGRRAVLKTLLAAGVTALAGCSESPPPWSSTPIEGLMPSLAFELTDARGRRVTADDYRDKVCLLYFGFTHCEDICPTTLATLSAAVRRLGSEADRVRVLFVSVDPWRDTPEVLGAYTKHFAPQVVGLTGDLPALATLARRYRVVFDPARPAAAEGHEGHYAVKHSNGIFAFDGAHRARLLMRAGSGVPALASDLRRLVQE